MKNEKKGKDFLKKKFKQGNMENFQRNCWSAQWFCVDSCAVCGGADEPSTASLRRGTRVLWMATGTPECDTPIQAG